MSRVGVNSESDLFSSGTAETGQKGEGRRFGRVRRTFASAVLSLLAVGLLASGCTKITETIDDQRAFPSSEEIILADDGRVAGGPGRGRSNSGDTTALMSSYDGSLRGDEAPGRSGVAGYQGGGASAGSAAQELDLNFAGTSIPEFLDRILRGALGVNYMAPGDLPGVVNFRSTAPVRRENLLGLVRDILGLNGLTIREFNGIYYVGSPPVLQQLATMVQSNTSMDAKIRIIPVPGSNANKVRDFVRPLLPPEAQVVAAPAQGVLYVQAAAGDLAQIESLVRMVGASSVGNDTVRIVPLTRSEPEQIAAEIKQLYSERGETDFTVIPLAGRQALMISAADKGLLAGIVKLVVRLDTTVRSSFEVRVIALKTIPAKLAADQLKGVFGGKASGGGAPASAAPTRETTMRDGTDPLNMGKAMRFTPTAPRMTTDPDGGLVAETSQPRVTVGDARRGGPGNGNGNGPTRAETMATGAYVVASAEEGISITADERNNSLLIHSDYQTFVKIRDVLESIDLPQAQVAIEATVLEVELNDTLQYGVSWYIQYNIADQGATNVFAGQGPRFAPGASGTTSLPSGDGPGGAVTLSGIVKGIPVKAVVQALQAVTNVKIISTPYLTVMDGQEAKLQIGQEVPFASSSTQNQYGQTTQTVQTKSTGIILQVKPKINGDNSVNLSVTQEVSSADRNADTGTLTPTINTRRITSEVLAYSGGTIALGGLITNRVNRTTVGLPIVSKVPVLGDLFKQTGDTVSKTELMILLTPRVLRTSNEVAMITQKLRRELKLR